MGEKRLEVAAVVPVYCEEGGIGQVLDGLKAALERCCARYEIVVVDDGSTDRTLEIDRSRGVRTVAHPVNRGYGRALVSGIEAAAHDWVLIIDGDGSYPPEEAERLIGACAGFDMVVGARQGRLFWGNPMQALLRWIYLSIAEFVAGEPIPDANSGLRLFKKSACLSSMPFWCFGYSFTTTMTLSFLRSGRFVSFVPVRYAARRGFSKVLPVRDILRTLQIMTQVILYFNPLKLAASAFLGFAALAVCSGVFLLSRGLAGLAVLAVMLLFSLAVVVFLAGCVLDSMRMHGIRDPKP